MTTGHHIAQANIAKARAPLTDPVMQGFVEQLDPINALADDAPGFVWRLKTEEGDATAVRVFRSPLIILNLSVWTDIESLYAYAFETAHREVMKRRREWFTKLGRPHSVLWWIPADERPSAHDARRRLEGLHRDGPTAEAFTFRRLFDSHGRPTEMGDPASSQ